MKKRVLKHIFSFSLFSTLYSLLLFLITISFTGCKKWSNEEDTSIIIKPDSIVQDVKEEYVSEIKDIMTDNIAIKEIKEIEETTKKFSFKMTPATEKEQVNLHFELVDSYKDQITIDIIAEGFTEIFGIGGYIIFPSDIIQLQNILLSEKFGKDGFNGIYKTASVRKGELTFSTSHFNDKTDVPFNNKEKIGTIKFKPLKTGTGILHFITKKTIAIKSDGSEIEFTPADSKIDLIIQ